MEMSETAIFELETSHTLMKTVATTSLDEWGVSSNYLACVLDSMNANK